jgi:hypothetical protein
MPPGEPPWEREPEWRGDEAGDASHRSRRRRDPPGAQDYGAPLVIFLIIGGSFLLGLLILAFSLAFG